jgi:hypothetical protein
MGFTTDRTNRDRIFAIVERVNKRDGLKRLSFICTVDNRCYIEMSNPTGFLISNLHQALTNAETHDCYVFWPVSLDQEKDILVLRVV